MTRPSAWQPRRPEGLIRKPDTARAERRKAKAERASAEKERLREELKRLKNLKKKEIEVKMQAIARVAGAQGPPIGADALDEEEWDPERHEAMMAGAFGEVYYEQSDDEVGELKKPQFEDMEDELKELLTAQAAGERGFAQAARRAEARAQQLAGDDEDEDGEEAEDEEAADGEGGNRFSKRAMKKWRKALEAKLEEYYRLDCEDFVAGLPCRFRYRTVAPDKFGLRTEELLLLSDKELNQVVSLKKLAPYREADPKPKYGDKRQRAEAALSRMAHRPQGGGGGGKRFAAPAEEEVADPSAAAASRLASFTAPTKKARREAMEQRAAGPKLTKNAAKRLRKKRAKEGKQQARDDIDL